MMTDLDPFSAPARRIVPDIAPGTDLPSLAARPVLARLARFGAPPAALTQALREACARLMDSDMIIRQSPHAADTRAPDDGASTPLRHDESALAEEVLARIAHEGLAPNFRPLMRTFIRMMFALFFTPQQYARACRELDAGMQFAFLMSDGGGPTLSCWRTVARRESEGPVRLSVDKVWGIEAHRDAIAVVAARLQGAMIPTAYLVWPEIYRELQRTPCGDPFLGGTLQLANVRGEILVSTEDRLRMGGPIVFNKHLTLVRPFFVRALMAHLDWLAQQHRLRLDAGEQASAAYIAEAAREQTRARIYSFDAVQRVMALKFAANELLSGLVRRGAVRDFADQRDLLAFSKMEGSSYRCFHELRAAIRSS